MTKRRLQVELILDARNYLDESKRVSAEIRAQEVALEHLGDETDAVSTDMSELAKNTDAAVPAVADLGEKSYRATDALKSLDARIASVTQSVRSLGIEFAATGDDAADKNLALEQGLLGRLTRLRKEVAAAASELEQLGDTKAVERGGWTAVLGRLATTLGTAASSAGSAFMETISKGFDTVGPFKSAMIVAAVTAAAAAAPAVGASLAGGIALGVGTLGLAGGIIAASKHPAVQSAATEFGSSISTMFFHSADALVGRIISALAILKRGFVDLDLGETFKIAAPYIEIVAQGIADMGRAFMPRFNEALRAARPSLEILAQQLPAVGHAFGSMLETIAKSKGMTEGVLFLFGALVATLNGVGNTVGWLSDRFHDFNAVMAKITGMLEDIPLIGKIFGDMNDSIEDFIGASNVAAITSRDAGDAILSMGPPIESTSDAMERLTAESQDLYSQQMDIARASVGWAQAIADLQKSFADEGRTLDENTQKGRNNWRATLDAVDAARRQRDANVANGVNMQTANSIYESNIKKIQAQAGAAHASASQIAYLSDQLRNVPRVTNATLRLQFERTGTMLGEHSGLRLNELLGHRASGGPVNRGGTFLVGEHGPELLQMSTGQAGYVHRSVESWSAATAQSPSSSPVNITLNDIDPLSGAVIRTRLITDALNRNQTSTTIAVAYP